MSPQHKELTTCLKRFIVNHSQRDVNVAVNNFVLMLATLSIPVDTSVNIINGGNVSDTPRRSPLCYVKCNCKEEFHLTLGMVKKIDRSHAASFW